MCLTGVCRSPNCGGILIAHMGGFARDVTPEGLGEVMCESRGHSYFQTLRKDIRVNLCEGMNFAILINDGASPMDVITANVGLSTVWAVAIALLHLLFAGFIPVSPRCNMP